MRCPRIPKRHNRAFYYARSGPAWLECREAFLPDECTVRDKTMLLRYGHFHRRKDGSSLNATFHMQPNESETNPRARSRSHKALQLFPEQGARQSADAGCPLS